jgi:hypothetical protein
MSEIDCCKFSSTAEIAYLLRCPIDRFWSEWINSEQPKLSDGVNGSLSSEIGFKYLYIFMHVVRRFKHSKE